MSQATLRTARLELVPLAPQHGDFLYQLDADPDVMKYIGYGKPLDAKDSKIVHKLLLETAAPGTGLGCWAAFSGRDFVGWWVLAATQSHVTPSQSGKIRAEFGLRVLPKFWGQGLAKEGSRELLKHGFQDLGVDEIFGETMTVNKGSRATMASCGLNHVRTFHNQYDTPPPGIEEGEVEYRITKEEWLSMDPARK
ncbi:hypothetical protein AK830_g6062 [Neonectria ditissima]|uniref:N-acetyltransferase domain-containing protein n=1 Tax=Neonectria ditissima TaxID=78410 RepID=A0A0P7BKB9_9HYPO|nr:hypothetical protein AK830_g6062 [Neonectria ditissima]